MSASPASTTRQASVWALMVAVAVVLADSSVVTLALPDIVAELGVPVDRVTWVLTSYNLVLALVAMPAAWLVARSARRGAIAAGGLLLFAAASAACAAAGTLEVLIGARVLQAVGGALLVTAALSALIAATGSRRTGAALWAASGVAGTAIGPFAGGLLTELLAWQAIFIVQVPLVLLALPAISALRHGHVLDADPSASAPGSAAASGSEAEAVDPRSEADTVIGPIVDTLVLPRVDSRDRARGPRGADGRPGPDARADRESRAHPTSTARRLADDAVLLLISAALTAALFLIVLLLIEGWRRTPITAALAVTVMPAAAILTRAVATRTAHEPHGADAVLPGAILVAGGLAALGALPGASLAWVVVPQILIGAGLALTIEPLTARSLQGPDPLHDGGRNLAVRHLGIVAGLALLTPIFLDGLDRAQAPARQAVTALVVDAPLPAAAKLSLAEELVTALEQAGSRLPELGPAFDRAEIDAADRPAAAALQTRLDDQLDRAATQAFRDAFLVGAGLAALAALLALGIAATGGRAGAAAGSDRSGGSASAGSGRSDGDAGAGSGRPDGAAGSDRDAGAPRKPVVPPEPRTGGARA